MDETTPHPTDGEHEQIHHDLLDTPYETPPTLPPPLPPQTPSPLPAQRTGDLGGLRIVIVFWCFWLLGAWASAWVSDTSVPRVRWMLFAGTFGLMLVWPAFRLSERLEPGDLGRGALQVLLDWLALVMVYQAVIWSLHLIAAWPIERGAWLDGAVCAWSLLSALIVATARLWPGIAARWLGMLLCLALVVGEPIAIWLAMLSGGEGWAMRISPVQAIWELTASPAQQSVGQWDQHILLVGFVAVSGWAGLGLWAIFAKKLRRQAQMGRASSLS